MSGKQGKICHHSSFWEEMWKGLFIEFLKEPIFSVPEFNQQNRNAHFLQKLISNQQVNSCYKSYFWQSNCRINLPLKDVSF